MKLCHKFSQSKCELFGWAVAVVGVYSRVSTLALKTVLIITQLTCTRSNSTIETVEKGVKYVQS